MSQLHIEYQLKTLCFFNVNTKYVAFFAVLLAILYVKHPLCYDIF